MPALMSKRPSAALSEIHRELDRRRKLAAVAKGRIMKKSSAPSPIPNAATGAVVQNKPAPIPHEPAGAAAAIKSTSPPMPHKPANAATRKPSAPIPHAPARVANKKSSAPISRTTPPVLPSSPASESIKRGSTVRVRTPVGTLPTGLCLVLWLSARVVSDAEDGYFEVIYNGDFPRDDPFRTVRVAWDQVKSMPCQQ